MEFLQLAPDIDSDPDVFDAGFWGGRVFELLLKVSALKDLRGVVRPQYQRTGWLARQWNLSQEDLFGHPPAEVIAKGVENLLAVGLLTREGENWVIRSWEKYYDPPVSNSERSKGWRERQRAAAEAESAANVATRTERHDGRDVHDGRDTLLHPTPPNPTPPNTTQPTTSPLPPPPDADGQPPAGARRLEGVESDFSDQEKAFLAMWSEERESRGLARENWPRDGKDWLRRVLTEPRAQGQPPFSEHELQQAVRHFLGDEGIKAAGKPLAVFIREAVWRPRMGVPSVKAARQRG